MKTKLLIIDPQNDFTDPKGSLYVKGAEEAISNICKFIDEINPSDIIISQDTHQKYNIGFADFWDIPELKPFDKIEKFYILDQIVKPRYLNPERAIDFYKQFENYPSTSLTIWPYHCIEGSWGWCFPETLLKSLNNWSTRNKKTYEVYRKGIQPEIEAYSIIPSISTDYLQKPYSLILNTDDYSYLYIAGFCKDICVAESVKALYKLGLYVNRLVFLDNCMATLDVNSENLKIYKHLEKSYGAISENA